jgi:hypothetical protein
VGTSVWTEAMIANWLDTTGDRPVCCRAMT